MRKVFDGAATDEGRYSGTPTILYDRETRRLGVEMATGTGDAINIEGFESNARLGKGRWYHVALVRLDGQRRTRLYVNGILDASQGTQGYLAAASTEPLFIGGDPAERNQCGLPLYMDELKIYDRPITPDEIQAEASPAFAGVEPSFVRLACISCPLEMATRNCPDGYHICNSLEMHMGGYQVARTMGWLERDSHVWSHTPVSAIQELDKGLPHAVVAGAPPAAATEPCADIFEPLSPGPSAAPVGLGLCCSDA